MKKILLPVVLFFASYASVVAQKGDNKVGIGAEIAIPSGGEFGQAAKTGFGGWIKFLFGVGNAGHVSFSSGYTSFTLNGSGSQESASIAILPLMIGYQYPIISGLYIEPQAGYASYHAKYTSGGQSASGSQGAFTYAVGMGYTISDIDFGLRYQSGKIENVSYANIAVRVGYNFNIKNKSSK